MSTKTIAVDSRIYEKLAGAKRSGESFSKTIDRLLDEVGAAHSGRDILRGLESLDTLSQRDAAAMLQVVNENRSDESWEEHDLR